MDWTQKELTFVNYDASKNTKIALRLKYIKEVRDKNSGFSMSICVL